jgi:hypothetical protein
MPYLNPSGSGARMLADGTNSIGFCLQAVGGAILNGKGSLAGHVTANAAQAYSDAGVSHQHATHAPADFPMFFTGAGGKGDVVIAVGDGVNCIASDYTDSKGTHWGHIGEMALAARARQVGGTLLGWTDLFLGYTLTSGLAPSGGGGTPITAPYLEEDMLVITATGIAGTPTFKISDRTVYRFLNPTDLTVFMGGHPGLTVLNTGTAGNLDANGVLLSLLVNYQIPLTLAQVQAIPAGGALSTVGSPTDAQITALGKQIAAGIVVPIGSTPDQIAAAVVAAIKFPTFPTVPTAAQNAASTVALFGAKTSA